MPTQSDMHTALKELAAEINRVRPDWRNSEEFYELRSEITGRLHSLADSPQAIRTVVRPVRVEVPVPVASPAAASKPLGPGFPVTLNADELAELFRKTYERRGGYQDRYRKWQQRTDRSTGVLLLTPNDTAWVWRQGSSPWKGTFQKRTRKIFWRGLEETFTSYDLSPSFETHLPTSKARRAGKPQMAPKYLRDPQP